MAAPLTIDHDAKRNQAAAASSSVIDNNSVALPPPPLSSDLDQLTRCSSDIRFTLAHAHRFYIEDKLYKCTKLLDDVRTVVERRAGGDAMWHEISNLRWVKLALVEKIEVDTILRALRQNDGWKEIAAADGIHTYYRSEEGSAIQSVKVVGSVDSPATHLIAVINECDLLPTFMTMVKMWVRPLIQVSKFSKVVWMKIKMPPLFEDRDIVFEGRGVDITEEGMVVIVGKNVTTADRYPPGLNVPIVDKGVTRMTVHLSGGTLQPINPNKTQVTAIFNVDLKLRVVPTSLINFFTKKLAHFGFKLFRRQCAQIVGSPYMLRVQSNRALYADIEERMNAFFGIRTPPLDLQIKEGTLRKKAKSGFIKKRWHTCHCTLRRESGLTICRSRGDHKGALVLPVNTFSSIRIKDNKSDGCRFDLECDNTFYCFIAATRTECITWVDAISSLIDPNLLLIGAHSPRNISSIDRHTIVAAQRTLSAPSSSSSSIDASISHGIGQQHSASSVDHDHKHTNNNNDDESPSSPSSSSSSSPSLSSYDAIIWFVRQRPRAAFVCIASAIIIILLLSFLIWPYQSSLSSVMPSSSLNIIGRSPSSLGGAIPSISSSSLPLDRNDHDL